MTHELIIKQDTRGFDMIVCTRCYHEHHKEVQAFNYIKHEWVCDEHLHAIKRELWGEVEDYERRG